MNKGTYLTPEELAGLKEIFREQSRELLNSYTQHVLELERASEPGEHLKAIERVVHTLKGDSMALEFHELAKLAHRLEDLLGVLRKNDQALGRPLIDLLLACGDAMGELLEGYTGQSERPPLDTAALRRRVEEALAPLSSPTSSGSATSRYRLTVTFVRGCQMRSAGALLIRQRLTPVARILEASPDPDSPAIEKARSWILIVESEAKPEALKQAARVRNVSWRIALQPLEPDPEAQATRQGTGEVSLATELEAGEASAEAASTPSALGPRGSSSDHLRVEVSKIDRILNLVGELVIGRSMVTQALSELSDAEDGAVTRLSDSNQFLGRMLTELQAAVLKVRMVPVEQVFRRFPRVVRDLAQSSGKEVELEIRGAETELDKSIVDALGEPLLHMVRNAIDHGLETPEERRQAGKPEAGRLVLSAFYEGNHVHLVVEDDGCGMDVAQVARRAVALGLVDPKQIDALPPAEILNTIYQPGFSTRESVSTVSGRGIGMDVVRRAIENLKGTIELGTEPGRGTRFLIRLPLTLAIMRAILVEAAGRAFAVPLAGVLEIVRLLKGEAESILGKGVMHLRDQVIPLVHLQEALGLQSSGHGEAERVFVLLVGEAERRMGLVADNLLGEHELVVKPIEDPLARSPGIAGASILGDGRVVLILNVGGLSQKRRQLHRNVEVPG